ncbi:hypothetical protein [Nodosilinea sp. LEGE 07088]|nr:hypothetical protein [Nodosilinea sp. LEGE 07088]
MFSLRTVLFAFVLLALLLLLGRYLKHHIRWFQRRPYSTAWAWAR